MSTSETIDLRDELADEEVIDAPEVLSTPGSLGQAPSILQLAWPAVVGNLLMSVVGIVGIKVVGTLGTQAVAAVTTGHRIFFISQGILMALTAGTTWHTAGMLWRLRPSYVDIELHTRTRELAMELELEPGAAWMENGGLFIACLSIVCALAGKNTESQLGTLWIGKPTCAWGQ